ncbi:hypothetical protein [Mastigocoleus sp. MO_188.B34]|uniref:hypothetical protein n=1 Tax=Mastigocoleus sp. MO_188.B34 TaxID=3036635 RepID=UPI0026026320|nr:hypothetical protein [Mastigocoleus sp. MO_188.B34]MDJ0696114.1 hypothetical protein [Mastigocoleus sp. MO_188.B34]
MKTKFLAIIAASLSAVGSIIAGVPANAVEQEVNVEITIQPTMFLRTFENISLDITQGDLGANDKDFDTNPTTDGNTSLTVTPRPSLTDGSELLAVQKQVKELYAVWANSGTEVNVSIEATQDTLTNTTDGVSTAIITEVTATEPNGQPTATQPLVGGANFTFNLTNATATGTYNGGVVRVKAEAQL